MEVSTKSNNIENYIKENRVPKSSAELVNRVTGIKVTHLYNNNKAIHNLLDREVNGDRHPAQEAFAHAVGVLFKLEEWLSVVEAAKRTVVELMPTLEEGAKNEVEYLRQATQELKNGSK